MSRQGDGASTGTEDGKRQLSQDWDVVVIGAGNAALAAAMTARDLGARVLVLERADRALRGGNTRHTRNVRCVHDAGDDYSTGAYPFEEMWRDLCGVGTGPSNEDLARLTLRESRTAPQWMSAHGVAWQRPLRGTLHLGRTNRFFLGGGKALLNSYHRYAERRGIAVVYEADVTGLELAGDHCTAAIVAHRGGHYRVAAPAVVCASGGFEANLDWLRRYWGDAVDNYHIRGPRFNDGTILRRLLDAGARAAGDERGFHAVAVDARSPKFDGGIATRIDSIPFGIVVNRDGRRFYDEGEDIWPKRYAIWGANLARQPGQIGYVLWDDKVNGQFLPPMYGRLSAPTPAGLAAALGLDPRAVAATVAEYNAAVPDDGWNRFAPDRLDGVAAKEIRPPKSNWALPLDRPPFYGIPCRPGITFTYRGVAVDAAARVQREDGTAFDNIYAAGEIMSGNILSTGYMAGFGMTIGTVWGRIAGKSAASHVI